MRGPALVSIHDVMPDTLGRVAGLLSMASRHGITPVTLLVVPGTGWQPSGLAQLRRWVEAGHELAGHGWTHQARHVRGLRHRLHSLFVSRDCAEHLALDGDEVLALMRRCRQWFDEHGLPAPSLYVPPAWAMGPVARRDLDRSGFRRFETMGGVYDAATGTFRPVPLLGFEARSAWQVPVLHASNAANRIATRGGWYRVAIHPDDHLLPLASALERAVAGVRDPRSYRELGP